MKILVVFYSRTGKTAKIADMIAKGLHADQEEIVDCKKRKGLFGFFSAAKDALLKMVTDIQQPQYSLNEYDVVCVGTPVWGDAMAPAVRTYLSKGKIEKKKIILFCTTYSTGITSVLDGMKLLIGEHNQFVVEKGFTAKSLSDPLSLEKELHAFIKLCKETLHIVE